MLSTLSLLAAPALFGTLPADVPPTVPTAEASETSKPEAVAQQPAEDPLANDFRVWWDEGLHLKTGNGKFALKFGGRLHLDWHWMRADDQVEADKGEFVDGTEIRRGRIELGE